MPASLECLTVMIVRTPSWAARSTTKPAGTSRDGCPLLVELTLCGLGVQFKDGAGGVLDLTGERLRTGPVSVLDDMTLTVDKPNQQIIATTVPTKNQ